MHISLSSRFQPLRDVWSDSQQALDIPVVEYSCRSPLLLQVAAGKAWWEGIDRQGRSLLPHLLSQIRRICAAVGQLFPIVRVRRHLWRLHSGCSGAAYSLEDARIWELGST